MGGSGLSPGNGSIPIASVMGVKGVEGNAASPLADIAAGSEDVEASVSGVADDSVPSSSPAGAVESACIAGSSGSVPASEGC